MTIELKKYGFVISDGVAIYQEITQVLSKDQEVLLDFTGVKSMVTFVAKEVFGQLYIELGSADFFKRVRFTNVSLGVQAIIKLGIMDAAANNEAIVA